jgi:tRNA threonylcarbamoyladenosine biosynthesis protein TsaE
MTRSHEFLSRSSEQTLELGRRLGEQLSGGEVILLFGPLGAGKTVFVRGLASGLSLEPDAIRSPSFTLINEHQGRVAFYHVDLYRLSSASLTDLGLEDLYRSDSVVAVEWAERLEEAGWDLGDSILVEIDYHPTQEDTRILLIDGGGLVALEAES